MVVAFDIDDTLVKEREFCLSAFAVAARICSEWLKPEDVIAEMTDALMNRRNHYGALEELLASNGATDKADMREIVTACRSHFPRFSQRSVGTARKWIGEVIARGFIPAIISDGRSVTQRNKLRGLGIMHLFSPEDILISDEQGSGKTDPAMFRKLMELHPGETEFVYVGDNTEKDFIWPNRLGWKTVGIRDRQDTNIHPQRLDVDSENLPGHWC